ncbi:MAG: hypothetical protein ACRDRN_22480 [Sciscionella sp.]
MTTEQDARELVASAEFRLAGPLAQPAADGAPDEDGTYAARVDVFPALERATTPTMAKGIDAYDPSESCPNTH